MPSACSLFLCTVCALFVSLSVVTAIPITQQKPFTGSAVVPSESVQNTLSEYYEEIVDQVMDVVSESMHASAPTTFMSAQHYQITRQDECRTSLSLLMQSLGDHLSQLKASLLSSVRPLLANNLRAVTRGPDAMIDINHRLAYQLGTLIRTEQTASDIVRESMVEPAKFAGCVEMDSATVISAILNSLFPASAGGAPPSPPSPSIPPPPKANEAVNTRQWLRSWLQDIGGILAIEFDKRMHQVVQAALEESLVEQY